MSQTLRRLLTDPLAALAVAAIAAAALLLSAPPTGLAPFVLIGLGAIVAAIGLSGST